MKDEETRTVAFQSIQESLARYARGVDRGDWTMVRSSYHPNAHDTHAQSFSGGVDGLIEWLDSTFAGVDSSVHMLGQSIIEFAGDSVALAETYFSSVRFSDGDLRQSWGRYIDEFVPYGSGWVIKARTVVIDVAASIPAQSRIEAAGPMRGQRDGSDWLHVRRRERGLE